LWGRTTNLAHLRLRDLNAGPVSPRIELGFYAQARGSAGRRHGRRSTFDFGSGLTYSSDWVVPKAPTKLGNQDIAFFDDVETLLATPSVAKSPEQTAPPARARTGRSPRPT
jgi:hypothetical protein